jgi:protein SCO1/2
MTERPQLDRRTVLRAAGATALGAGLAGCTDVFSTGDSGNDDVVLGPPKNYERRKDLDLPYPTYGEEVPEVTVPAPFQDRTLSTREFVGERHAMLTFVYTSCVTVCIGLTNTLRHVQADSVSEEYTEEMAFMPMTFDPKHDTESVLRSYCKDHGINFEAGNWYFLRPESPKQARTVVSDTFGVAYQRGEDMEGRHFTHSSLILLVNKDGYVERAYNGEPPSPDTAIDDARTVVEGW